MELDEIDIPPGKFILLGGGIGGKFGFSLCGTFSTLEQALPKQKPLLPTISIQIHMANFCM